MQIKTEISPEEIAAAMLSDPNFAVDVLYGFIREVGSHEEFANRVCGYRSLQRAGRVGAGLSLFGDILKEVSDLKLEEE